MQEITEAFLGVVAGDIEKLLQENREAIVYAYQKIQTGMKLSIGIALDPTADGICVNYAIGFDLCPKPDPPEKHRVKYKHTINEAQGSMDLGGGA
jgi:hypothetical protein